MSRRTATRDVFLQVFEAGIQGVGKTGPECQIRSHAQRAQIELGLCHRIPVRVLSRRFSISKDSLHRHRRNHLPPQTRAAILAAMKPSEIDLEQLQRSESESLLANLVLQRSRLQRELGWIV